MTWIFAEWRFLARYPSPLEKTEAILRASGISSTILFPFCSVAAAYISLFPHAISVQFVSIIPHLFLCLYYFTVLAFMAVLFDWGGDLLFCLSVLFVYLCVYSLLMVVVAIAPDESLFWEV